MSAKSEPIKTREQFLGGFFYALIVLSAWFLVEGLYVAWTVEDAPVWGALFNLGVGAPLGLGGAILAGVAAASWGRWLGIPDSIGAAARAVRRQLIEGDLHERARRCAWLIVTPLLAGCWLGTGMLIAPRVLSSVKTPEFVLLLIVIIEGLLAALLGLMAPPLLLAIRSALLALNCLATRTLNRDLLRPAYLLLVMAAVALATLGVVWAKYPDTMSVLPWSFALGPLAGAGLALGAGVWLHARRRGRMICSIVLGASIFALGVFTLYLPLKFSHAREVFVGQSSLVSAWYGALEPRLDWDGDGEISYYAGNDCAPHDPSIHPGQREIVGNGVDENCSGSDLVINPDAFKPGTLNHPKPAGVARQPNIILITTDALSAEHTTLGGYHRDTTPNLAEWAKDATVFEHAFSLSSSTRLALPGLLTGQFNSMLKMKNGRSHPYSYVEGTQTLASLLKHKGYRTVFVPGDTYFSRSRWPGVSTGFDEVDADGYKQAKDKVHAAPSVTRRALHHLEAQDPEQPIFLWVHYFDHHGPYKKIKGHAPFKGNKPVDRYDNELHWADMHWGELMKAVREKWAPEDYIMLFSSDHGESFGAGRSAHHGVGLGTELLHVPMIIQGPKQRGKTRDDLISQADIPPTLLNLAGINAPETWIGESLVPTLFEGRSVEKDLVYGLLYIPEDSKRQDDAFRDIVLRTQRFAYIENLRTGRRKLVDWKNDPHDKKDLSEKFREEFELYRYLSSEKLNWLREREEALSGMNKKLAASRKKKKMIFKKEADKAKTGLGEK